MTLEFNGSRSFSFFLGLHDLAFCVDGNYALEEIINFAEV